MGVKHKPGQKSLKTEAAENHKVIKSVCNEHVGVSNEFASFKSHTRRDLNHIIGENNPGVGQFNIKDHKSIGVPVLQGGAPNNFLILSKNLDPWIHKVETNPVARLHVPKETSKFEFLFICYSPARYRSWCLYERQGQQVFREAEERAFLWTGLAV